MSTTRLTQEQRRSAPCPYCGVGQGWPCEVRFGIAEREHAARIALAYARLERIDARRTSEESDGDDR